MLAHFVQHRKLSRREIEELKRILDGKEKSPASGKAGGLKS
jgi:predicted transcriptional regulator